MNRKLSYILWLFLLLVTLVAKAQSPTSLPTKANSLRLIDETYNLFQDSRGFVWIGTNNGAYRYDSNNLEHFSEQEGLGGLDIMNVSEDFLGRIWFSTYRNGLFYYDYNTQEIKSSKQNAKLIKLLKTRWVGESYIAKDSSIFVYVYDVNNYTGKTPRIKRTCEVIIMTTDTIESFDFTNEVVYNKLIERTTNYEEKQFLQFINTAYNHRCYVPRKAFYLQDSSLVKYTDHNVMIDERTILLNKNIREKQIKGVIENHKNELLISVENTSSNAAYSELLVLQNRDSIVFKSILLDGFKNRFYQDNDNRYWFWSKNGSIDICPNLFVQEFIFNQNQNIWYGIEKQDNILWGWSKNGVFSDISTQPIFKGIYALGGLNPEQLYIDSNHVHFNKYDIESNQPIDLTCLNYEYRIKTCSYIQDSILIVGTATGFLVVNKFTSKLLFSSREHKYDFSVYSLLQIDNKILIGTDCGLYSYDRLTHTIDTIKKDIQVNNMFSFEKKDMLALATNNKGIYVAIKDTSFYITTKEGLNHNHVNRVYGEQDSILWVGGNNGLQKIIFHNNHTYSIYTIINNQKVTDIEVIENQLYIIANNQIKFLNKKLIVSQLLAKPLFYIKKISINDTKVGLKENYQLQQNQNNITIELHQLNFDKIPNQLCYQILREGEFLSDNWQTTNGNVEYRSLQSGKWFFYYTTLNELKDKKTIVKRATFEIEQPITEKLWFLVFIALLCLFLISLIVALFYERQKRAMGIKRRLVELKLNLLRAQMNPHFIYNAMNSILGYIMRKDLLTTANYFSRFAMLMRNIMENTQHPFISLDKEIEALEIYLELEQLRLGEKHKCILDIEPHIRYRQYKIPPMLIQPFVENAILHGITPLIKGGIVQIILRKSNNNMLQVLIEDNGVGREKARLLKAQRITQKRSKSMGIHNSKERINIINETYEIDIQLTIEDLKEGLEPIGTRVILLFPPINEED